MKTLISSQVDEDVHKKLEKIAAEKKWTISFLVNELLKEALKIK